MIDDTNKLIHEILNNKEILIGNTTTNRPNTSKDNKDQNMKRMNERSRENINTNINTNIKENQIVAVKDVIRNTK